MSRLCRILAVATMAAVPTAAPARAGDPPPPDLRGIWLGEGPTVLLIAEQLGTALEGRLSTAGNARPIYDVMQRDRKEIMFVNPERRAPRRAVVTGQDGLLP